MKQFFKIFGALILGYFVYKFAQYTQFRWLENACTWEPPPAECTKPEMRTIVLPRAIGVVFFGVFLGVFFPTKAKRILSNVKNKAKNAWNFLLQASSESWVSTFGLSAAGMSASFWLFSSVVGLHRLRFTETEWLRSGDTAQAYLCSVIWRQEDWTFPLGKVTRIFAPLGTNSSLCDVNPFMATLFKILREQIPPEAQYFGVWLLFCHLAQGFFCAQLAKTLYPKWVEALAATLLASLFPPMLVRYSHINLMGMWCLPAMMWLLAKSRDLYFPKRASIYFNFSLLLLIFTSVVHPYLTFYAAVIFGVSVFVYPGGLVSFFKRKGAQTFIAGLVILALWWSFGIVGGGTQNTIGSPALATYASNLNTFWDPRDISDFIRPQNLYINSQWEGMGYLGLGVLLIYLLTVVSFLNGKRSEIFKSTDGFLLRVAVVGFLLALGCVLSLGSFGLKLEIPIYSKILTIYRASGRAIWLSSWVLIFLSLRMLPILSKDRSKQVLACFVLLAIQIRDLKPGLTQDAYRTEEDLGLVSMDLKTWEKPLEGVSKIMSYPSYEKDIAAYNDYRLFWRLAAKHKMQVSPGYLARVDKVELEKQNAKSLEMIQGKLEIPSDMAVVFAKSNQKLKDKISSTISCENVAVYTVCRSK